MRGFEVPALAKKPTTQMKQYTNITPDIMPQVTAYGTLQPLYFYIVDGNSDYRADQYTSRTTGEITVEGYACTKIGDLSPVHRRENYSSDCSCCYLGMGHTQNYHNESVMWSIKNRIWSDLLSDITRAEFNGEDPTELRSQLETLKASMLCH